MSKKMILLFVVLMAITLALPAYAAVQNIKISGDVTVRSLMRNDYDLDKHDLTDSTASNNDHSYFMHSVGVNLAADLTDQVGVVTRLINQRDWNTNSSADNKGTATDPAYFDVDLDLGYVALKEFFFAPLSVTVGRQHLVYGRGFIVGTKLLDFNNAISANEYTETYAFDAIRAVFDLNPWTFDLAYSKMSENTISNTSNGATLGEDDVDLYIANMGYKFDQNNAETEFYAIAKIDGGYQLQTYPTNANTSSVAGNRVYTLGARGSLDLPANLLTRNLNMAGEIAHQIGTYNQTNSNTNDRNRDAWAVDLSATKAFPDTMWSPTLNLEYVLFTGENSYQDTDLGRWHAWDAVYRGSFYTAIREFQNYYYATKARADNVAATETDMDSGLTNVRQVILTGTINPIKKLTVKGTYAKFWFDERLWVNSERRSSDIGQELDWLLTYAYSNDVSMNLLIGNFLPGKYWTGGQKDPATDIVGSVKLTF